MPKYRKKPVVVDAFAFGGECQPRWFDEAVERGLIEYHPDIGVCYIETLEGAMEAHIGEDVIIRGVEGEIYPCKVEIFAKTYEEVIYD